VTGCSGGRDLLGAGNMGGAGNANDAGNTDAAVSTGTPSAEDGGPAATADDGGVPSGSIDWSPWSLQEPDGQTQTTLKGYKDAYFYPAGSYQAFMDTMTGVTTSGSLHPRCELRENASWLATGKNTLTVSGRVTQIGGGSSGKTTVGQVFNADNSIPLAELIYLGSGKFEVLYEEAKGGGTNTPTNASAALGTDYNYELSLSAGQLTVVINGSTVFTKTPSAAVANNHFYFKAGDYDQTATAGAISTVPYTVVENSAIQVAHQ
jgi:hypothetical protein